MELLEAHAEELIIQGRKSGNDEDDTEEYGAVLRAGLQSLQRVHRLSPNMPSCVQSAEHAASSQDNCRLSCVPLTSLNQLPQSIEPASCSDMSQHNIWSRRKFDILVAMRS